MNIADFKKVNLDNSLEFPRLSQIYSRGYEFAIANSSGQVITPFMLCKDYLQDMYYGYLFNKKVGIYGFSFDPEVQKLSKTGNKLLIRNKETDINTLLPWVINSVEFTNQFFKSLLGSTKLKIVGIADGDVVVLNLPSKFFLAPPILSLFTLIVRISGAFNKETDSVASHLEKMYAKSNASGWLCQSNDLGYLKSSRKFIEYLCGNGPYKLFSKKNADNWPEVIGNEMSILHNYSGTVSYTGGVFDKQLESGSKYSEQIQKTGLYTY